MCAVIISLHSKCIYSGRKLGNARCVVCALLLLQSGCSSVCLVMQTKYQLYLYSIYRFGVYKIDVGRHALEAYVIYISYCSKELYMYMD